VSTFSTLTSRYALAIALAGVVAASRPLHAEEGEASDAGATGKVLGIEGKVLDIVGVTLGVEGALRDLGAKVTAQEIRIELAADVLFDFDKATLRSDAVESLRKLATVVAATPGAVTIEGHTDSKGADDYNLKLSESRAASVKAWLVREGKIDASRLTTRGLGEKVPKVPNEKPDGSDDPDGRQKNRRVEIVIRKVK
jgi:outer membrane protein OmpA-like peptidoglycan-associated protein